MKIRGVHRFEIPNGIESIGTGYIVIPHDVDRENYVTDAMRREKVVIMPDEGSGYISECNITKSALNQIEFPDNDNELGSAVVFITNMFHNVPTVLGVINKLDDSSLMDEKSFLLQKQYNRMMDVTVLGLAKEAYLLLTTTNESGDASIVIKSNGNAQSKIQIETTGDINMLGDENLSVTTGGSLTLRLNTGGDTTRSSIISFNENEIVVRKVTGDVENVVRITDNEININPNTKLNIKQGSEPLVKGTQLQNQLNVTNNYISTLVSAVNTALTTIDGVAGSVSAPTFRSTMEAVNLGDYNDINSEIAFTD